MDPKDLSDNDLTALLQLFRHCAEAGRSRFFFDLYMVVEREGLRRTKSTAIQNYSNRELNHAVEQLKELADSLRAERMTDDHPMLKFVLVAMTAALSEVERREAAATVH